MRVQYPISLWLVIPLDQIRSTEIYLNNYVPKDNIEFDIKNKILEEIDRFVKSIVSWFFFWGDTMSKELGLSDLLESLYRMKDIMNIATIPEDIDVISTKIIRAYESIRLSEGEREANEFVRDLLTETIYVLVRDIIESTRIPKKDIIESIKKKLDLLLWTINNWLIFLGW